MTAELKQQSGRVKRYKYVMKAPSVDGFVLVSPNFPHQWHPDWNSSNYTRIYDNVVNEGIHVV